MHEDHIRSARLRLWGVALAGIAVLTLTIAAVIFPVAWVMGAASNPFGTRLGTGWGLIAWSVWVGVALGFPTALLVFGWSLVHAEAHALEFVRAWPGPSATPNPPPRLPEDTIPRVEAILEVIAIAAGVRAPKVAAIDDDAPNCLTVGRSTERAWLVVTTGLVESLSKRELEAVLAYELGRVVELEVSFDTVVYASTSRGFEVWVAAFSDVHHLTPLLVPLAILATPFLLASIALRGAALRNRAALADGLAVRYCRDPGALVRALRTIHTDPRAVRRGDPSTAHLWLEYPHSRASRWFLRTHRILPRRIRRLEQVAGATGVRSSQAMPPD